MSTSKSSEWKLIPDEMVEHEWAPDKDCEKNGHDVQVCRVSPYWYSNNGIPQCAECGQDFLYNGTFVRKQRVKVHVYGGVAYPPENLPEGIEVEIIDHDNY